MIYWYHVLVLCPWSTFHAWVTIVRKKCLSIYISVPIGATFIKLAPTVHLDMIYWCHMMVCILDLHFTLEWPWLGRNGSVPIGATFTKLAPTVHLDMFYWCHMVVCILYLHFTLQWPRHKMEIAGLLWWFPIMSSFKLICTTWVKEI